MDSMEQQKSELITRMQRKARSILFVGVGAGLVIIMSVLIGSPLPPTVLLSIVLALIAFIAFQVYSVFSIGSKVKRLRRQESEGDSSA